MCDKEITKAMGNLSYLTSGLADASMLCHLFGDDTQEVIDLCDEICGSDLDEYKRLREVLRTALDEWQEKDPRDWGGDFRVIQAFWCAVDREIAVAES